MHAANARFARINEAYAVLSDERKRNVYDSTLARVHPPSHDPTRFASTSLTAHHTTVNLRPSAHSSATQQQHHRREYNYAKDKRHALSSEDYTIIMFVLILVPPLAGSLLSRLLGFGCARVCWSSHLQPTDQEHSEAPRL
jgi:curved DNA-binding protein CbpA